MASVTITRNDFLKDRQGRTFADVANDSQQPLDVVLDFFNDGARQRRMEESEIHHDRPPLAGVVRELESLPDVERFLSSEQPDRTKRLRQAIGVVVRMLMEGRGWKKTGKKGSLGVRLKTGQGRKLPHNTGGLAFWFLRAERYEHPNRVAYPSVRSRAHRLDGASIRRSSKKKAES